MSCILGVRLPGHESVHVFHHNIAVGLWWTGVRPRPRQAEAGHHVDTYTYIHTYICVCEAGQWSGDDALVTEMERDRRKEKEEKIKMGKRERDERWKVIVVMHECVSEWVSVVRLQHHARQGVQRVRWSLGMCAPVSEPGEVCRGGGAWIPEGEPSYALITLPLSIPHDSSFTTSFVLSSRSPRWGHAHHLGWALYNHSAKYVVRGGCGGVVCDGNIIHAFRVCLCFNNAFIVRVFRSRLMGKG